MLKTMKQMLALLCVAAVCCLMIPAWTALAATSGDFSYSVLADGTAEISRYSGSAAKLKIPSKLDGYRVTGIGAQAFSFNFDIENIVIPGSIEAIGERAFYNCNNLTTITILDGVKTIEASAFQWCINLINVSLSNSIQTVGKQAFMGCEKLSSVHIPSGVQTLEKEAFRDCKNLKNVRISEGVTTIGEYCFGNCTALTDIDLPNSLQYLKQGAFYECDGITSVSIPDGITNLPPYAFNGQSLAAITLPRSITQLEDGALTSDSLQDIFYAGSENEWSSVSIGGYHDHLKYAKVHYNTTENHYTLSEVITPVTCVTDGQYVYTCDCGYTQKRTISATGHTFKNSVCVSCKDHISDIVAYKHSENENDLQSWIIYQPDALSITVTFDKNMICPVGENFLHFYNAEGTEIRYATANLPGQSLTIQGDTLTIQFVAYANVPNCSLMITDISAQMYNDAVVSYYKGDTDGDWTLSTSDARSILMDVITESETIYTPVTDYDRSGVVNTADIRMMLTDIVNGVTPEFVTPPAAVVAGMPSGTEIAFTKTASVELWGDGGRNDECYVVQSLDELKAFYAADEGWEDYTASFSEDFFRVNALVLVKVHATALPRATYVSEIVKSNDNALIVHLVEEYNAGVEPIIYHERMLLTIAKADIANATEVCLLEEIVRDSLNV